MMKKLFSGGGNDKSSWVGKVLHVGKHQCFIEEIIAEGGYALVFLVKSSLGHRYALKRVSVNELHNLEMCKQEIQILKKLSGHKNTILFVDSAVNVLSPGIYEVLILMEYCRAGHVIQLMNECIQTGFTEKMVMKIFCDVCEAVAFLHSNQPAIIHRDLKVENVLRKQSGDFVLCDYGSAYFGVMDPKVDGIQRVEEEIASCTTLPYRAPEMVDLYSGLKITTKSDIWALGCLLYKLCFFTTPFGESTLAIQNGQFTFPETSRFSEDLYSLIKMMLEVDQDKRPDIFQVADVAFRMIGKPCPVKNSMAPTKRTQLKPAGPQGQNINNVPRSASPGVQRAVINLPDNGDVKDQKNGSQQVPQGSAQQTARAPVSTSLAPRSRPKGVNKFSSANDVATPTPFKNESDARLPPKQQSLQQQQQQQQLHQHQLQQQQQKIKQQQQLQQQQHAIYQQQMYQQHLREQQQEIQMKQQQLQRQQMQQEQLKQQQIQQQLYYQQMQERQRMAQQLQMEQQQQQQLVLEQQRQLQQQQQLLEQNRRQLGNQPQQQQHESVTSLRVYSDTQDAPLTQINPFEDDFSANHKGTNPFETHAPSKTADQTSFVTNADHRVTNYRSHFRSRSDTFTDLARRANSSDDETEFDSNYLKPVGDMNSPNKSVPDMRVVGNTIQFNEIKISDNESKIRQPKQTLDAMENIPTFDLPLINLNLHKPHSHTNLPNNISKLDIKPSHSEPTFDMGRSMKKDDIATKDSSKEKANRPTLEEADASPLISPSSSIQERQYVYTRTSSCSSEELGSVSDSSEEDDSKDMVDYLEIRSSSEEEDEEGIHEKGSTEIDVHHTKENSIVPSASDGYSEDVFGSAPFSLDSLKISVQKKHKGNSDAPQKTVHISVKKDIEKLNADGLVAKDPFSSSDPFRLCEKNLKQPINKISTEEQHSSEDKTDTVVSEDPFGSAPFVKIVKHKKPLSSQELTIQSRNSHPNRKVHQRKRMLPKAPIQE